MKRLLLAACAAFCCAAGMAAEETPGTDAREWIARAAMPGEDPARRLEWTLEALALNPALSGAYPLMDRIVQESEMRLTGQAAAGLWKLAQKYPGQPELILQTVQYHPFREKSTREEAEALLAHFMESAPEPDSLNDPARKAFLQLYFLQAETLAEEKEFEEADALIAALAARDLPEQRMLQQQLALRRRSFAMRTSPERRWFGLLESERQEWFDRSAEALDTLRRSERTLTDWKELGDLAFFYTQMHRGEDALRVAERILSRDPENPNARFLRGQILLMNRHYDILSAEMKKLCQEYPAELRFRDLLAEAALRTGEYDVVRECGKILQQRMPDNVAGQYYQIVADILEGKTDIARAGIGKLPDSEIKFLLEGMLSRKKQDWKMHLARLRKFEKTAAEHFKEPLCAQYLDIACVSRDPGLLDECWERYRKMEKLQDPEIANNLAYSAALLQVRMEEARELSRLALEKDPENAAYLDTMAWIEFRSGNPEKAMHFVRMALEFAGPINIGEICEHAGDIALALDDRKAALHYYRMALAETPNSLEVDPAVIRQKIDALAQ